MWKSCISACTPRSKSKAWESNSSNSSNKDAPLIDLNTDVSDVKISSIGETIENQQGFLPSGMDIFDSLSPPPSRSSQYCNLGTSVLPRPIFGDIDPDPFSVRTPVAAAIAAPLLQSLSLKNRNEMSGENAHNAAGRHGAASSTGPPYFESQDDSLLFASMSAGGRRRGPARSLSPPPSNAMHNLSLNQSSLKSDLFNSHSQTTGIPISIAMRASSNGIQQSSNPFKEPFEQSKNVPKPSDKKNEHAFDWLEEALRGKLSTSKKDFLKPLDNFSALNTDKGTPASKASYHFDPVHDKVPVEKNFSRSSKIQNTQKDMASHPMYDEVPNEEYYAKSEFLTTHSQDQATSEWHLPPASQPQTNKYQFSDQNVPHSGDSSTTDAVYGLYSFSSNYSDVAWGSEFNDDDFLEEYKDRNEDTDIGGFNCAPPIPPRTYHDEESRPKARLSHTHILPMMQHGEQRSHTHYFCIPAVNTPSHYSNFGGAAPQQAGKMTAAIKPYNAYRHQAQYHGGPSPPSPEGYENAEREATSQVSLQESGRNRWSVRSSSSSSPHVQHHEGQFLPGASGTHDVRIGPQQGSVSRPQLNNPSPELIGCVLQEVIGVTEDECRAALSLARWDVRTAVQYLKVEQLFRLGVSSRSTCRELLERLDWNLELAGSVLADRARAQDTVQCESAV